MNQAMIDIETLGHDADHVVLSIGIAVFTEQKIIETKEIMLDVESQLKGGKMINASTLEFWSKQPAGLLHSQAFQGERYTTRGALHELEYIMQTHNVGYTWAKSVRFDLNIISDLYKQNNMEQPWKYYNEQELRTLIMLYPQLKNLPFRGTKHGALADAVYQAEQVMEVLKIHST